MVAETEGPGANLATIAAPVVRRRLGALLDGLGDLHPEACCAGAAGAEVPARRARLRAILEARFPGCRVEVVHDARIALAAAGLDEGVVLIAGTGSVAYARSAAGREAQVGGWGWLIGDEGSGVWIAREGAREVMRRADAGEAAGPLGQALLAACRARDAREMTSRLHSMREPMRWAALARVVFEAAGSDPAADSIVERAATALSELASAARKAVRIEGPVVLAGGLLLHEPALAERVRANAGGDCIRLENPPVAGAVTLAERLTGV